MRKIRLNPLPIFFKDENIFSRIFYSLLIVNTVFLFILLSFLTKPNGSANTSNKVFFFFQILLILPIKYISWRELLKFAEVKFLKIKSVFFSILSSIPFLFLGIKSLFFDGKSDDSTIKQYFGLFFICLILLFFFSWKFYEKIFLLNFQELRKKYSFLRLNIWAFIFWNSLTFIGFVNGAQTLIFLIFGTILTDTIAYIIGTKFGRNYLSKTSPKKTWEGLIIGTYLGICIICSISIFLGIKPCIYKQKVEILPMILISPMIFVLSAIGDIFFSKQKRIFQKKDFSSLLGNHGGFWDRFDSHTFALAPFFFLSFLFMFF